MRSGVHSTSGRAALRKLTTCGVCGFLVGGALICPTAAAIAATLQARPFAADRNFLQRSWKKADGLPEEGVQAIHQTRDGYLWTGSRRGLARFDGLRFTVFDHLNTPAMRSSNCKSLTEDREGSLWVATEDGLLRWRDGRFERFTTEHGLRHNRTRLVLADRRGDLWIALPQGLQRMRNGIFTPCSDEQGPINQIIYALHQDATGGIWAGGSAGYLRRFNELAGRFEMEPRIPPFPGDIMAIQADGADGLWLLVQKSPDEFRLYRWSGGELETVPADLSSGFRNPFLHRERRGGLWFATGDGGLDQLQDGKLTRHLLPSESAHEFVLCLTEDYEGNLWLGTEYGGLQWWKPKAISVVTVHDGLAHDNAWTVCEAPDGSIWTGTGGGVSQLSNGSIRNFTRNEGLSSDRIRSVAADARGDIWVGTDNGLNVIRNGRVEQRGFPHRPELNKVRVVYPARNGAVWVGTVAGLFRWEAEQWTTFTPAQGLAQADLFGDVRALREDRAGNLWIGTFGGGLQCFRDGKFTTFTMTNGLSNNFVWALHADADGVLWIGTENGLNRYADGHFTAFTTREGLPVNLVNEILEDAHGNLWVSHDHGIYRLRKSELNAGATGHRKTVQALRYDESDGLISAETNGQKSQPAGCRSRDGRLWFPTTKGVAVIDPNRCDRDEVAPTAVIEQVRADGEIVYSRAADGTSTNIVAPPGTKSRRDSTTKAAAFRLPPGGGRVLEFRYTAPVFNAPEKTEFCHRLRGVSDNWIEAGARREAYFMRLRPGNYSFEVMAANHRGVWGSPTGRFDFFVQPHYYQTTWFYLICGLTVTLVVVGVVRWRWQELRKIHLLEQQSAIAGERERIAKDLHDGLGADLTRLALLADLASGETGTGEHLQKISRSSREAARLLKEMIWISNPANDTAEGLVSRICQTAEDFLADARIRCRLNLAPELPRHPLTCEERRNLLLVAREVLNNIVKHASATEVNLGAQGSRQSLELTIADNGRGFDPMTVRPDALGLVSMKRRMENLGGSLAVESRKGSGTTIRITIKLGETGHAQPRN